MNKSQKRLVLRIVLTTLILLFFLIFKFLFYFNTKFLFLIFLVCYILIGYDIVFSNFKNMLKLNFLDEKSLMFIATIGAFFLKQYFEAVIIFLLYQVGEVFQNFAISNSKNQISYLLNIKPKYANLRQGNSLIKVSPSNVKIGDLIVVKPGERIPLDGVIIKGGSFLDVSSISGESNLLSVGIDDRVLSGSVNVSGVLEIVVEKAYEDSTVKKILDLIENVSSKKSKSEALIKKFAKIYTPSVVFAAFFVFFIPVLFLNGFWKVWLERSLIFLVISCPCALVISVPVSFFLAISKAAKIGVLVKGSIFLEKMSKIKTAVFDKTGTLTNGSFSVLNVSCKNFSKRKFLEIISLAESSLNHPIAKSILKFYGEKLDFNRVLNVKEIFGKGVKATVDGKEVFVGNLKLMKDVGFNYLKEDQTGTNVHLSIDGKYIGYLTLKDLAKPNVEDFLKNLKKLGVKKLVMLTGDRKIVGEDFAKKLPLDFVFCELLPFEKVEKLEFFLEENPKKGFVVFVGDGVNDAAALKRADVGISMGVIGSDAAMESCDIVLMDDDLNKLVCAILVSKKVIRVVKQNIIFSLFFKCTIFVAGIFGFTNIWLAIFSDVGVSILAILNSFRVFRKNAFKK